MASRLRQVQTGVRPVLKARLLVTGPAGAGKTESSLRLATEMLPMLRLEGRILMIDTERDSALTYSKRTPDDATGFAFDHLAWAPPYNPRELAETLDEIDADRHPIVIIDSFSHFWNKEGGTLDIAGGKITNWKDARPIQNEAVDALLRSHSHVIICARQKMAYAIEEGGGKTKVTKLGMETIQADDLEYEVQVTLVMATDHTALVTKSRAGDDLPVGTIFQPGRGIPEFAERYVGFLVGGVEMLPDRDADLLRDLLNATPALRKEWRAAGFPPPTRFPELRRDELAQWLAARSLSLTDDPSAAVAPDSPGSDESAGEADNAPESPVDVTAAS